AAHRARGEPCRGAACRVRSDRAPRRRRGRDHPFRRGRMNEMNDPFVLAGREYRSRLIVGTGKYKSFAVTRQVVEASGAEIAAVAATIEAAKSLVKEGFQVLPYVTDDPVACKRLEELGCAAVMPLAAPIGSGLGVRNPFNLRIIVEQSRVPVIVDAGVGTASHAAEALELGCDAVLMNTAIAGAKDALLMAEAMRLAVEAGRKAFLAG